MILSDRSILEEIKAGRIEIDPFDEACIQPSSIDLHVDRKFRTFHNARYPFIDVKKEMPELTELIEVDGNNPFILHPGEFVLGSTLELSNVANLPITIYPGMKIGQISFFRLTSPAEHPYGSRDRGSKYQGQRGPTASRFFEEFEGDDDADRGESDASP